MRGRAGFTLVELTIALTILGLVTANMLMVSRTGSRAIQSEAFRSTLEDDANLTAERVRKALLSAAGETLDPVVGLPLGSSTLSYQTTLGVDEAGRTLYGDPERIRWSAESEGLGRVVWVQAPELPEERALVWSKAVPSLSPGEELNGVDDNTNGFADEPGLVFAVEDREDLVEREVDVHLSLLKLGPEGRPTPTRRHIRVTCRN